MKKFLILMLVMALTLMFVGCGDDNNDDPDAVTKVSFRNQTNADITVVIDGIDGTLIAGETWNYTFVNATWNDDDMMAVDYTLNGLYIKTTDRTVTIEKDKTVTVNVIAEGGIVVLKNNHYIDINSALIYLANEAPSGSNSLVTPLTPGDSVMVLKDAESYRVSLMLANGTYEAIDAFTVADNQMSYATITAEKMLAMDNQTNGEVTFRLDGGSINRLNANTSEDVILGEEYGLQVEVSYNGLYIFAGTDTFNFFDGTTYDVIITPDGGAIYIVNGTSDNITEVYIAPSSDTEWGPDYMSGTIGAGQEYAWTVQAGSWDVKIVDDAGFFAEIFDIQVTDNQSEYVDYSDKAKTRGTSSNLKNKAHYNYPVGGTKVEGN